MQFQASLFSTGDESVRLLSQDLGAGVIELTVCGPLTQRVTYTFNSLEVCEQFRATVEARLQRAGFTRLPTAERRQRPR